MATAQPNWVRLKLEVFHCVFGPGIRSLTEERKGRGDGEAPGEIGHGCLVIFPAGAGGA